MKRSIPLEVKNELVYCDKKNGKVNIHSMTHSLLKVKVSEVCDSWTPNCPDNCRYYAQSKK